MEKEKPPIPGMIQRGGEVVVRMPPNVRRATIEPLITRSIATDTLINPGD